MSNVRSYNPFNFDLANRPVLFIICKKCKTKNAVLAQDFDSSSQYVVLINPKNTLMVILIELPITVAKQLHESLKIYV